MELTGKVVVITGAGGVLCSCFAKAIASRGAKVALLDLNYSTAAAVADEIKACGGMALAVEANVLDKESLVAAKQKIDAEFGACDILINGAGGNNPRGTTTKDYFFTQDMHDPDIRTFFDLEPDGVRFVFDLNLIGTLLPTQVFAAGMTNQSCIINVSSMNAFTPLTRIPAYSAAKAAVSNFTQWLAVHMSRVGVRVNALAPGFFLTNQNHALLINQDGGYTPRAEKIINATPMQRFGKPEELLGTLFYLMDGEASGFVTGVVIPVDGGFSAYSGV